MTSTQANLHDVYTLHNHSHKPQGIYQEQLKTQCKKKLNSSFENSDMNIHCQEVILQHVDRKGEIQKKNYKHN